MQKFASDVSQAQTRKTIGLEAMLPTSSGYSLAATIIFGLMVVAICGYKAYTAKYNQKNNVETDVTVVEKGEGKNRTKTTRTRTRLTFWTKYKWPIIISLVIIGLVIVGILFYLGYKKVVANSPPPVALTENTANITPITTYMYLDPTTKTMTTSSKWQQKSNNPSLVLCQGDVPYDTCIDATKCSYDDTGNIFTLPGTGATTGTCYNISCSNSTCIGNCPFRQCITANSCVFTGVDLPMTNGFGMTGTCQNYSCTTATERLTFTGCDDPIKGPQITKRQPL
jgi:hypothetical protein